MPNMSKSIEDRLRNEKPEYSAPTGFTERVMSRLPEQRESEPEMMKGRVVLWPRLTMAAALIMIAGVLVFEIDGPNGEHQAVVPRFDSPAVSLENADLGIPKITPEQIEALTLKIDQPLERELENVINDTRTAIQFVASNFLPEKYATSCAIAFRCRIADSRGSSVDFLGKHSRAEPNGCDW